MFNSKIGAQDAKWKKKIWKRNSSAIDSKDLMQEDEAIITEKEMQIEELIVSGEPIEIPITTSDLDEFKRTNFYKGKLIWRFIKANGKSSLNCL